MLSIIFLLFSFPSFSKNSLCRESFLKHLNIAGPVSVKADDVCALETAEIKPAIRSTLLQLKNLNIAIAETLGVGPDELFGEGIKLTIFPKEAGPLGSVSGLIGVFPDWQGGEIEPAVYVHEIGHVLLYLNRIPYLTALSRNTVFKEAFPDLLARSVLRNENFGFVDPTLPACGRRIRQPKDSFSYTYRDFFGYAEAAAYAKCCDSIPESERSPHFRLLCRSNESSLARLLTLRNDPGSVFDCVDQGPPPTGSYTPKSCAGHVFSEPLDHFLDGIALLAGKNKMELLLESSKKVSGRGDFVCKEVRTGKLKGPTGSRIMSFKEVLHEMKEMLGPEARIEFDRQWNKARVDFAVHLDDLEVRRMLQMRFNKFEKICMQDEDPNGCEYICNHEK